jgi:hypothetical protein
MRYRKLDAHGDMTFGNSLASFWIDVPDAPAQAIKTRLWLNEGEWFLAPEDGTPWNTQVLGKYTASSRDIVVRGRVLGTPGVIDVDEFSSAFDRNTRGYAAQMRVATEYGQTTVIAKEPV